MLTPLYYGGGAARLYEADAHAEVIGHLLDAAISRKGLSENILPGLSVANVLDNLSLRTREDDGDSRELLFNLALGQGDIAGYARQLLCQLVGQQTVASEPAANMVRACAQELVSLERDYTGADISLDRAPALLLLASCRLHGEQEGASAVPAWVRERVAAYEGKELKPQWWLDYSPRDGVFDLSVSGQDISALQSKDYLVKQYALPADGACFFRALLAVNNRSAVPAITLSKPQILSEISGKYDGEIKSAIAIGIENIREIYGDNLPATLRDISAREDMATLIYDRTIGNGEFALYSGQGLAAALGSSDTPAEIACFDTLADAIGEALCAVFAVPRSSREGEIYLTHHNGNHWDLVGPAEERR